MKKPTLLLSIAFSVTITAHALGTALPAPQVSGTVSLHDIAADGEQLYYTCAIEEQEKQIRFFEFDHNHWHEILLPADTKAAGHLDLQIFNGIPYILFTEDVGLTLIKYEEGQWFQVGKPKFSSEVSMFESLDYTLVNGIPYIIFQNYDTRKAEIMMLAVSEKLQIWANPDANALIPSETAYPKICADISNTIYTAWYDKKNEKVQVSQLISDDEKLTDMSKGLATKNVNAVSGLHAFGNELYILLTDLNTNAIIVQHYNRSAEKWETITATETMQGLQAHLSANLNISLIADDKKVRTYQFENNTWLAGQSPFGDLADNVRFCSSGSDSYAAFTDSGNGNKLIIQKF